MLDRRSRLVLALALCAACHDGGGAASLAPLPVGTHNLARESRDHRFDGEWVVSATFERLEDLNHDGDAQDAVPVVTDARTGQERVLPWAISAFEIGGGFLTFTVSESEQGGTDLDGNGRNVDHVLFLHDLRRGTTRNLDLAVDPTTLVQEDDLLAAVEGDQLVLMTLPDAVPIQLARPVVAGPHLSGRRVVVEVREDGTDANGDGDGDDVGLLAFDFVLARQRWVGRAIVPGTSSLDGEVLAYRVSEAAQGETDLDGDGDADDEPLELADLASGQRRLVTEPVLAAQLGGDLALLYVAESADGSPSVDRNGDGDTDDHVFAFYDRLSGTLTETGLAAASAAIPPLPVLNGRRAAFCVGEADQGVDLDGDGQANDLVLALFDGATGRTTVDGRTCEWGHELLGVDERHVVYAAPDPLAPGVRRPVIVDLATGNDTSLDLAVTRMNLVDGRLLCTVAEWQQDSDLNDDGRLDSAVQVVVDPATGEPRNTRVAVAAFPPWSDSLLIGDRLLVPTHELLLFEDQNGDGDMADPVLRLVRLR